MNKFLDKKKFPSEPFAKFVALSTLVHLGIFLVFTVKAVFFPSEPIQLRHAIRVDIVDLPDRLRPSPPPPAAPAQTEPPPTPKAEPKPKAQPKAKVEPKAKPKAEPKPKPKAEPKAEPKAKQETLTAQQRAMERLRAQQAVERIREQVDSDLEPRAEPPQFKGNILADGDSLTGLERIQYDRYIAEVRNHIHTHWNLPQWLAEADLRAQALVRIDGSGFVTEKRILSSSGNDIFDAQVLGTIEKASPFPQPPSRLRSVLSYSGFVFQFPE